MKRKHILLIILGGMLVLFWILARLTNMFQIYTVPSGSNYPTIKPGERIYGSNLKSPRRFDLIAFYTNTPEFGHQIYTQRLCAMEGDTVTIQAGTLYINGKNADEGLTVAHNYALPIREQEKLQGLLSEKEFEDAVIINDSIFATLPDQLVKLHSLIAVRKLQPVDEKFEEIKKVFGTAWNNDYFGPVVVPKNKYFMLGDNRSASQDSRYLGFVGKEDYVCTILNKH